MPACSNFPLVVFIIVHMISCHWLYSLMRGKQRRKRANFFCSVACCQFRKSLFLPWKILIKDNNYDSHFKILTALLYLWAKWEMFYYLLLHTESGDKLLGASLANGHWHMINSLSHGIRMSINSNYCISRFVCLCFTAVCYSIGWSADVKIRNLGHLHCGRVFATLPPGKPKVTSLMF